MIIKYRLISGENEDFVRDIEIIDDNSFYDLHLAIQAACNFDHSLLSTFYLSNKSWDKEQEIVLEKMDAETQESVLLMQETWVSDVSPKIGQRLIYIFDFFSVRALFIEIVNIREFTKEDEHLQYPICTLSHGKPPEQILVEDLSFNELDDEFDEFSDGYNDDIDFENIDDLDI